MLGEAKLSLAPSHLTVRRCVGLHTSRGRPERVQWGLAFPCTPHARPHITGLSLRREVSGLSHKAD